MRWRWRALTTGCLAVLTAAGADEAAVERLYVADLRAPKVLWLAGNGANGAAVELRRTTGVDVTFFGLDLTDLELHHLTDKPLEEPKDVCAALRERHRQALAGLIDRLGDVDVLVLSVDPATFDPELLGRVAAWVEAGGRLLYSGGRGDIAGEPHLGPLMPMRPTRYKVWQQPQQGASDHWLSRGLPLEELGAHRYIPIYEAAVPDAEPLTWHANPERRGRPDRDPWPNHFWYRRLPGGGQVVFLPVGFFERCWQWKNTSGGAEDRPDDHPIWRDFFRRLCYGLTYGRQAYPVVAGFAAPGPGDLPVGQPMAVEARLNAVGPSAVTATLALTSPRLGQLAATSRTLNLAAGDQVEAFALDMPAGIPVARAALVLTVRDGSDRVLCRATRWLHVTNPAVVGIAAPESALPGAALPVTVTIGELPPGLRLWAALVSWDGHAFQVREAAAAPTWATEFVMPADLDGRHYAWWITVVLMGDAGPVAVARRRVYNDEPWDMRRQFQWSVWTGRISGNRLGYDLLVDAGFNAFGMNPSLGDAEARGLRAYVEGCGINTWNPTIDEPDWGAVETAMRHEAERQRARLGTSSRAPSLVSLGEESGFKSGWGKRYYWEEDQAPPAAQQAFAEYLREVYGNDLAALNAAWGADFAGFADVPLTRDNARGPKVVNVGAQNYRADDQERQWNIEVDLSAISADKPVIAHTAPMLDSHAFFDSYYQRWCDLATRLSREILNPVPRTIMSAPANLYPKVDVYNFHGLGPFYPKETGLARNAAARLAYGDGPGFSAAMWAYFDLHRLWRVTVESSIAAGNTHLDYWVDTPLTFNHDLSHTRASFWTKRLIREVAPLEPLLLTKVPAYTPGLAMFAGRQPLAKGVTGRFFNGTITPDAGVYSALTESGLYPRYVNADGLADQRVVIASYAELLSVADAAKLRAFVNAGGLLICTPWLGSVSPGKNMLAVYPDPATGLDELLGFQLLNTSQRPLRGGAEFTVAGVAEEPLTLVARGYDEVLARRPDVEVLATHADGQPALLTRQVGRGRVVWLNFVFDWSHWWNSMYEPQREACRRLFLALVERHSSVRPSTTLRYVGHDPTPHPGWWGTKGLRELADCPPGAAVPHWAVTYWRSADEAAQYAFVFAEHRAPTLTADFAFADAGAAVYDLRRHERVPAGPVRLTLGPGGSAWLAAVPSMPGTPRLAAPRQIRAGEDLVVQTTGVDFADGLCLSLRGDAGTVWELRNLVFARGGTTVRLPLPADLPAGEYTLTAVESIGGTPATATVRVAAGPDCPARALLRPFPPRPAMATVPLAPEALVAALRALTAVYRQPREGLDAKYSLSYFIQSPFPEPTRHRLIQSLAAQDWPGYVPAVAATMRAGERFILLGEDLGADPGDGLTIDGRRPTRVDFLDRLAEQPGARRRAVTLPDRQLEIVELGEGGVLYDPVSLSDLYLAADFAAWQRRWLDELAAAGW